MNKSTKTVWLVGGKPGAGSQKTPIFPLCRFETRGIRSLLLVSCFFTLFGWAQQQYSGVVLDHLTSEPLAFATLVFDDNSRSGMTTDLDGRFTYRPRSTSATQVTVSYVGYTSQQLPLPKDGTLTIRLVPALETLEAVTLSTGENPALAIIRKVIANKHLHNPERLRSFAYRSYTKSYFDIKNKDSIAAYRPLGERYLFLTETVSHRKFLRPDLDEEVVVATRLSGFRDPKFALLTTRFLPFSFYDETIHFLELPFLNPISNNATKRYDYRLEETLHRVRDTAYIISYHPKKGKKFEGLRGLLHISSDGYAVQHVTATPTEEVKMPFTIKQTYQQVEGQWFPNELGYEVNVNMRLLAADSLPDHVHFTFNGRTHLDSIQLNLELRRREFSPVNMHLQKQAAKRDSTYWESYRREILLPHEQDTYTYIDSISLVYKLEKRVRLFEKLPFGLLPAGSVDIDVQRLITLNRYEDLRLGLGLQTNEKLLENLTVGGFFGYGFGDKAWKYGGYMEATFWRPYDLKFDALWENNLVETGRQGLDTWREPGTGYLSALRNLVSSRFDSRERAAVGVGARSFRYLKWKVQATHQQVAPNYDYTFQTNDEALRRYTDARAQLYLRLAYKEEVQQYLGRTLPVKTPWPVLRLLYTRGISGWWDSRWDYDQVEAELSHTFFIKNLGHSRLALHAGYSDSQLPYGLLFTGEGSLYDDNKLNLSYTLPVHFQTMEPYAYLSNRYVSVFATHNFGGLLFKAGKFQPDIVLHHRMRWGTLAQAALHGDIDFQTQEKPYIESGLVLDKLLKIDYFNLASLGLGGGAFYRYGSHGSARVKDNLAWVISFTFGVK